MVQAYCAGLLNPGYPHRWTSRIREELLLEHLMQQHDAATGLSALNLRAHFASRMQEPQKVVTMMLKHLTALQQYGEGDPTALLGLSTSPQEIQMLQELWHALKDSGIFPTT